jgi:class 3 adenylate cyclase
MTEEHRKDLFALANELLNKAEEVWKEVGDQIDESKRIALAKKAEDFDTQIPGYPIIKDREPLVDEFVSIVTDMRDSTNHLLQAIAGDVSQLKRVYFETAVLLPVHAQVVSWQGGSVTEYLGDGTLGLFLGGAKREESIYAAHRAAQDVLTSTKEIINPILKERYKLPPLEVGVGLAISDAIVTLVGLEEYKQPKVFGQCVFRATKLATGRDEIFVDEGLEKAWPKSDDGKISFLSRDFNGLRGFKIIVKK